MNLDATPFHARAVEANRLNAWENRGTFTLATHYGSVEEEAIAARFGAVLADVSWHWRVELSGEEAAALVSRLFSRDASALGMGAAMDVLWLNDAGAVRGQGTVVRLDRTRFRLVSAAEDFDWIAGAARLYGVGVEDRTRSEGALALIGPAASKILGAAGFPSGLSALSFRTANWRGLPVSLARLGLGFVVGCQADDALVVWDRLMAAGRAYALIPAGQAALDMVETESGMVRPLRDYTPACEGFAAMPSPQSLGLTALVDRAHLFNGRAGVLAAGPDTNLTGVVFDGEAARPGTALMKGTATVGRLLVARYCPAMKQDIGFAVLQDPAPEGPFTAGGIRCRPVELPFLPLPAATETGGEPV
jgi:aminomethyltransferase